MHIFDHISKSILGKSKIDEDLLEKWKILLSDYGYDVVLPRSSYDIRCLIKGLRKIDPDGEHPRPAKDSCCYVVKVSSAGFSYYKIAVLLVKRQQDCGGYASAIDSRRREVIKVVQVSDPVYEPGPSLRCAYCSAYRQSQLHRLERPSKHNLGTYTGGVS